MILEAGMMFFLALASDSNATSTAVDNLNRGALTNTVDPGIMDVVNGHLQQQNIVRAKKMSVKTLRDGDARIVIVPVILTDTRGFSHKFSYRIWIDESTRSIKKSEWVQ
jgi:hypothetical protein